MTLTLPLLLPLPRHGPHVERYQRPITCLSHIGTLPLYTLRGLLMAPCGRMRERA
jgi:hypothetical protein